MDERYCLPLLNSKDVDKSGTKAPERNLGAFNSDSGRYQQVQPEKFIAIKV